MPVTVDGAFGNLVRGDEWSRKIGGSIFYLKNPLDDKKQWQA
jgi:hypothetical protein